MKSKLCWFSFFETEFGTESSYLRKQTKERKNSNKNREEKESQQVNSKMEDFGKTKSQIFGEKLKKKKCTKKKKKEQINKKQGTEFSAIY
jgi:hypothetical protein